MTAAEVIAESLAEGTTDPAEQWTYTGQCVLDALKAAGYAVIELASEEQVEDYGLYVSRPPNFGLAVGEEHDQGSRFRSSEETRRYAAALLAIADAADAAEATS